MQAFLDNFVVISGYSPLASFRHSYGEVMVSVFVLHGGRRVSILAYTHYSAAIRLVGFSRLRYGYIAASLGNP